MTLYYIAIVYLLIVNILGFTMMGIDKQKAIKKRWRIRESTLFLIALVWRKFWFYPWYACISS